MRCRIRRLQPGDGCCTIVQVICRICAQACVLPSALFDYCSPLSVWNASVRWRWLSRVLGLGPRSSCLGYVARPREWLRALDVELLTSCGYRLSALGVGSGRSRSCARTASSRRPRSLHRGVPSPGPASVRAEVCAGRCGDPCHRVVSTCPLGEATLVQCRVESASQQACLIHQRVPLPHRPTVSRMSDARYASVAA